MMYLNHLYERRYSVLQLFCFLLSYGVVAQTTFDTFNYGETLIDGGGNNVYGPEDWGKIKCNDKDTCVGISFSDTFENSQGWSIGTTNHCEWCPAEQKKCGVHHGSPINLERSLAIENHPNYNICIDGHWISYFDSSCSFDELREKNAFTIERYGLKITQPMTTTIKNSGVYGIDCVGQPGTARRWGRCDFPKGYSQWWLLSHIDFHVPSEHTQEGKRYDGELQMFHFYSEPASETGVDNEMGTISIFLEVYDNADDWPMLNKVLCAWREAEEKNRAACGLPSITSEYPGCFRYTRGHTATNTSATTTQGVRRSLQETYGENMEPHPEYKPATSAYDIILENEYHLATGNTSYKPKTIFVEEENLASMEDFDWAAFIASQYEEEKLQKGRRKLMNYDHLKWFNYFPMIDVRTEYFYRYQGTMTTPPCYGKLMGGKGNGRKHTNAWRVMKDPIQVTQRQIDEMHRLIRERIAPKDSPFKSCKPDTAAKIDPTDPKKVIVARPLQSNSVPHFAVYCECANWGSHWKEDRDYCRKYQADQKTRFYSNPYNWEQAFF